MSTVTYADIIEIEMAVRKVMKPHGYLIVIQPSDNKNTPYEKPVRVTINSNTFYCDRDDLLELQDPFGQFDLYETFINWLHTTLQGR